jgi:DNA modification methylase
VTPYWEDEHLQLWGGDCREVLAQMPAESVHCVVTSPPYWGLRDYGTATWDGGDPACDHERARKAIGNAPSTKSTLTTNNGRGPQPGDKFSAGSQSGYANACPCGARRIDAQLGLEPTPEAYVANMVAVFREVRRVLRADGTLWLNLGSSYCSQDGYPLAPTDAAWLAGLIDGEGCIQIHRQEKANGWAPSFQLDLSVGMMTAEAVQRAHAITGLGSCRQQNRGVWDWSVRGQQTATLLRAIYPYLVTKRRQAAYGVMLADDLTERRGNRVRPLTEDAIEYRQAIREAISALNQRQEPTLEMREPKPLALGVKAKDDLMIPARVALALQADGWFLRSEIVWNKPNPMPESVTDRPTKSHEMVYLFSKSRAYYYDADAVREASTTTRPELLEFGERQDVGLPEGRTDDRRRARYATPNGPVRSPHGQGFTRASERALGEKLAAADGEVRASASARFGRGAGFRDDPSTQPLTRNLRTVWTIATEPYPGAHFATFPRKLVEPCVKAGCPADGTVLDPFAGSGTTLLVAQALGRRAVGIDLNPEYLRQALDRNRQAPLGLVG